MSKPVFYLNVFLVLIMGFLIYMFVKTELKVDPHHHATAYELRAKSIEVTYCHDQQKIVSDTGNHIKVKVPLVFYPEGE